VDWSSTRPEPGAFIGAQLDDKHTDLLFSARLHSPNEGAETKQVYLYLLLEHQSSNDGCMPLRMYDYLGLIYNRHRKLHKLPLAHGPPHRALVSCSSRWPPRSKGCPTRHRSSP
jgi:hypothetical protein